MEAKLPNPPGHFEDLAIRYQDEGRWNDAAKAWVDAAEASLGRKRKDRYLDNATFCKEQAKREAEIASK